MQVFYLAWNHINCRLQLYLWLFESLMQLDLNWRWVNRINYPKQEGKHFKGLRNNFVVIQLQQYYFNLALQAVFLIDLWYTRLFQFLAWERDTYSSSYFQTCLSNHSNFVDYHIFCVKISKYKIKTNEKKR